MTGIQVTIEVFILLSDIFSDPVELVRMAKGLEIVVCIS